MGGAQAALLQLVASCNKMLTRAATVVQSVAGLLACFIVVVMGA